MALIKCPECGREVSDQSINCIGCGYPIQKIVNAKKQTKECPECKNTIAFDSDICNNCGYVFKKKEANKKVENIPIEKNKKKEKHKSFLLIPLIIIPIVVILGFVLLFLLIFPVSSPLKKGYSSQEDMHETVKGTYTSALESGNISKIYIGPDKIWFRVNSTNEEHEIYKWDYKNDIIETSDGLQISFEKKGILKYNDIEYNKLNSDEEVFINDKFFPDENFRNLVTYWGDLDKDGILSWIEIEQREKFDQLDYKKISSLKGIEIFTNLKELKCDHNNITELDCSKLVNLEKLDCSDNKIKVLILKGSNNLKYVNCENNLIEEIDCDGLKKIDSLYCSNNNISKISVVESNLSWLECANNKIEELNCEGMRYLTRLYCNNNNIKTLNVKNCSNLESLDCSYNKINDLDIKDSSKLLLAVKDGGYEQNGVISCYYFGKNYEYCYSVCADSNCFKVYFK